MQIKRGYAEGGFLDDGAVVDDVSGNEVPTGSLEAEVRDDIPAQLSEGEFVLPADVVRFIGLDKLMKMRKAAKAGLADMEEEGQIGGSPAPAMHGEMESMGMDDESMEIDALIDGMDSDDFEGAAQNFAQGGSVRGYEGGGVAELPSYADYTGKGKNFGVLNAVEYVKYTNAAGETIDVGVLRGEPLRPVPDGFYEVGTEPGDPDAPVDPEDSTVNSGGDERTANYKKSGKYAAELAKSEQIRRGRVAVLDGLHKSDMSQDEVDQFFQALTPDARAEYDARFRDPKFLDSYFTEDKSPVELMILAQETVNTKHRNAGTIEEDSGYASDGEPIDWDGLGNFLKDAALGTLDLSVLSPKSILTTLLDKFSGKGKSETGKVTGNNKKPAKVKEAITYNQAHWQKRMGDLGRSGLSPSAIQEQLRKEQRSAEFKTGRNAYGHKIYKEPGTRTVWDDIAEVQKNSAAAIEANINRNKIKTDIIPTATVDPVVKPTATVDPVVKPTATVTPMDVDGKLLRGYEPPTTATAEEVPPQDEDLLRNTGNGGKDNQGAFSNATTYDSAGNMVSSTPTGEIDISGEDSIPEFKYPDRSAEMIVTGKTPAEVQAATDQLRYDSQLELQNRENDAFLQGERNWELDQAIQRELDDSLGTLGTTSKDEWEQFITEQNNKPTEGKRKDRMIKQTDRWGVDAKARAEKINADRTAYLNTQTTQDTPSGRGKDVTSVANKIAIKEAIDKAKKEGTDNPFSNKYVEQPTKEKEEEDAADRATDSAWGLASGGLASKKKPAIKKMRKDSTSGLAAKKKSKERAKAKKGALAAKRT